MGADQPLIASDGLLARKSGEWAKRKLHFLRNYCGITTVAMRKKWRLHYLDVMAGPGRCKNAETGEKFVAVFEVRDWTNSDGSISRLRRMATLEMEGSVGIRAACD